MKPNLYIFFNDIYEYISQNYHLSNERIPFHLAIRNLHKQGFFHEEITHSPNFRNPKAYTIEELQSLIKYVPIFITDVLNAIPIYHSNKNQLIFPKDHPILICQEMIYSLEQYSISDYFVLLYSINGLSTIHIKNEIITLNPGEIMLISPATPFYCQCTESDFLIRIQCEKKHFYNYLSEVVKKNALFESFFQNSFYDHTNEYLMFFLPIESYILQILFNMFGEVIINDPYSPDVFMQYLQIFFAEILRGSKSSKQSYASIEDIPTKILFTSMLQYINANYATLTLKTLSEEFHYNASYLSALIHQNTGKTLSQLLLDLKINRAKQLLEQSQLSIIDISAILGFNSPDYFTAKFKKELGITPSQYRKKIFTTTK